jgi:hypothetical protein
MKSVYNKKIVEKVIRLEAVAQLVEHEAFNLVVAGSIPARLTNVSMTSPRGPYLQVLQDQIFC